MKKTPAVNYRNLRFNNIGSEEFRHIRYLLFWPAYLLFFFFAERVFNPSDYHSIYCSFDDLIPFCEFFVIPYASWYFFLFFMNLYTLAYDTKLFKRFMRYVIITFTVATAIYFIFPTCQNLRPEQFERDNIFTTAVSFLYSIDTNTNVLPSVHVIGSAAVVSAALHSNMKKLSKATVVLIGFLICLSTVFLKQHSFLDVIAAIPICVIAEIICYGKKSLSHK